MSRTGDGSAGEPMAPAYVKSVGFRQDCAALAGLAGEDAFAGFGVATGQRARERQAADADFQIAESFFDLGAFADMAESEAAVDFGLVGILGGEPGFEFVERIDF